MGGGHMADDFSSEFWNDDFEVDIDSLTGPLSVAQMTQANEHVPSDPEKFNRNAVAIADKFMQLMTKTR
jgi:hypothetical protein